MNCSCSSPGSRQPDRLRRLPAAGSAPGTRRLDLKEQDKVVSLKFRLRRLQCIRCSCSWTNAQDGNGSVLQSTYKSEAAMLPNHTYCIFSDSCCTDDPTVQGWHHSEAVVEPQQPRILLSRTGRKGWLPQVLHQAQEDWT